MLGVNWKLQLVLNCPDLSHVIIPSLYNCLCDVGLLASWVLFLFFLMCQKPDDVLVLLSVLLCVSQHTLENLFKVAEYSHTQ